ncbi:MAG: hypothetical protein M1829_003695 [Trizodia sp. TS-e1964]|nr:MAG: hypothetical protein M1829_003695 [Trizodia sp. TS-e1964]
MSPSRILIYLLRRDLRLADNPIFHALSVHAQQSSQSYTHLLPIYIFPATQIEISGFLIPGAQSPYPVARSAVAGFWRCGPFRAKFVAEAVWELKEALMGLGSGLDVKVGSVGDVLRGVIEGVHSEKGKGSKVVGVWMTGEEGVEEKREERDILMVAREQGIKVKVWTDEKYLIDDRDLPFKAPSDLPDVFTSFRKSVEPLRDAPRTALPVPSALPPLPLPDIVPTQSEISPFQIPDTFDELLKCLLKPLKEDPSLGLTNPPTHPPGTTSSHPFQGGSTAAHKRLTHLISTGSMTTYKATRNELSGLTSSTKLSAWLALGCLTARQVHWALLEFENGTSSIGASAEGYGKGENAGTTAVRFELLWRDYMRLCARKFRHHLFRLNGFRGLPYNWKSPSNPAVQETIQRFLAGRTGMGLIDASMRELYVTGWTTNRARQNAASFLTKHLGIDWRVGAEWFESMLVDYDVSSNWGNWQYVAGVGNDPREERVFNPVKQAWDYDPKGEYVKAWVEEVRRVEGVAEILQPWKVSPGERERLGLKGNIGVEQPLVRIEWSPRGGGGRGARGGGGWGRGPKSPGQGGRGGGGRGRGRGRGDGKARRNGMVERMAGLGIGDGP